MRRIQKRGAVKLACLLVALAWAGAVHAQTMFRLTPGGTVPTGGQLQIGTGLPLPVGTAGVFVGGKMIGTAATFPPLFVLPAAMAGTIMQNQSTPAGGAIAIPAGVLSRMADGNPDWIGVFNTNPLVYQVATTIDYSWPNAAATFAPGGGPGPDAFSGPAEGIITYSGGSKAFGGAAQFAVAPGAFAGSWAIPAQGPMASIVPIATVFLNLAGATPFAAMSVILVGVSDFGVAAPGAPTASLAMSTMFGPVPMANRTINQPLGGGFCTMWCVSANGGIGFNAAKTTWNIGPGGLAPGPTNMATATQGFPFTTGLITISAKGAVPPEVFFAKGTDMRVHGVGNISLVAGGLSQRMLSGPNANRAWVSLPEPTAALGAVGALGMLAMCHSLLRPHSREVRSGRGHGGRTR